MAKPIDLADIISLVISTTSLVISGITAWLTLLRKGTVKMTRPTIIFLGHDGPIGPPKIVLGAFLFSTVQRGQVIESMFVRLRRSETVQSFTRWVRGDAKSPQASGLYVDEEGFAGNHHFLIPAGSAQFKFLPGNYSLETYATLANGRKPLLLSHINLSLTQNQAAAIEEGIGVLFNWSPESTVYQPEVGKAFNP
jgi:hypothetical protein